MIRRSLYFLALLGALVFYWAYTEWLSWLFLLLLLLLPAFSLLMSLPAMLTCRGEIHCPEAVEQDSQVELSWEGQGPYPVSRLTGKMRTQNLLCGISQNRQSGDTLPTNHCGLLSIRLRRPRCYDYLGLFAIPIRRGSRLEVLVRPKALAPARIPDLNRCQVTLWRPKAGGGFSEQHELRLYRPGDPLRQVHWKLSAKVGKLITREAMEPLRHSLLLTLTLQGTPEQLDRKLGRLLWLSRHLLQKDLPHQLYCATSSGMQQFHIACPEDLTRTVDALLRSTPTEETAPLYPTGFWCYHIGGDAHE